MDNYTTEELKEMLSHYICQNGITLGKIYFKAHLNEGNRRLPDNFGDIAQFIDEFSCTEKQPEGVELGYRSAYQLLSDMKKDLKYLDSLSKKKESHLRNFIDKWLERLESFE
ncbi:MAG: hypothetical protein HN368_19540 [Spirochaetales bacterium]|nr:hypothetical protein [Spirochaetales bacterium]